MLKMDEIILARSVSGDGGWSLHAPWQIAEAEIHGEAPEFLTSGAALWDGIEDGWDRPNAGDYLDALEAAEVAEQPSSQKSVDNAISQ